MYKSIFVRICRVFYGSQGPTQSLFFSRCMEPFIYLDGGSDPSSTALTKRSRMLSNGTCVSRILSAGV